MELIQCKTIFFDLGRVLVDFDHDLMFQNIAKLCFIEKEHVQKEIQEKGLGLQYERGIITSTDLYHYFSKLAGKTLDYKEFLQASGDIFSLKTEVVALLPLLKKINKKLIVLSNTCEAHFIWLQSHYNFLKHFDDFVLSYEVKALKPEETIYLQALKQAKTPKEACFYVDDLVENISAAQKIGIDSHLFQGVEHLIQALQKRGCIF